uniref:Uncharacterized protein n=1 Tax=Fusarium oxysporum (strain Fo5176) TaxID=660025 RepID=A0A0C4DI17_FUSOF
MEVLSGWSDGRLLPLAMKWVRLSVLLLMLGSWAGAVSGERGGDAAVGRLRSWCNAGKLLFPNAEEAVGELPSETSLRSSGELLSGFFKLGAEGLENYQLGVVLFHALAGEVIGRFDNRDWLIIDRCGVGTLSSFRSCSSGGGVEWAVLQESCTGFSV